MSDIESIERRASKLLIAFGGVLLMALLVLVFNNLVLRGAEMGPIINNYKGSSVDDTPIDTVPPALQKRFYR